MYTSNNIYSIVRVWSMCREGEGNIEYELQSAKVIGIGWSCDLMTHSKIVTVNLLILFDG